MTAREAMLLHDLRKHNTYLTTRHMSKHVATPAATLAAMERKGWVTQEGYCNGPSDWRLTVAGRQALEVHEAEEALG